MAVDVSDADQTGKVEAGLAASLLERLPTTLVTNAAVSASALFMSSLERGVTLSALLWFLLVLLLLALRFAGSLVMKRLRLVQRRPKTALRIMTLGALATGLVWAALPYSVPDFSPLGLDSGLYILMCGMATGSVLLGIGHSASSLAFALPLHASVVMTLTAHGKLSGILLACNVLALTVVLYRSSRKSQAVVVENISATLKATALARSLSEANADITQANGQLKLIANRDPLTGLANRSAFNAALEQGIQKAEDTGEQLALLILDLDRFKTVNDTLGHSAGDALLAEVGTQLQMVAGDKGTIARLGGDEFAIILGGAKAHALAQQCADAILDRARRPILLLSGQPLVIGTSIGLALFPDHAASARDLFIAADMALYRAKEEGRRQWREFEPAFRRQAERRHQIETDIDAALASGAVEAWFQPQMSLHDGSITGFETLVRWHHPQLGPIAPPEIVAAAQSASLADRLTESVADAACRLLTRLPTLGLPQATVAINVSPREFEIYGVSDVLDAVTRSHGIDPALFEIEITEEAILDTLVAGEQLKQIERSGYKLAVDDFGAGHSSLAYLVGLKVDRLKLDRHFVSGIDRSRQNQEIVGAMVGLGRALSMEIVAEGVECEAELSTLRTLGCPTVQGYLLARPMPEAALLAWIANRQALDRCAAVA